MGNRATRVGMNQLWDEIIAGKLTRRDVLKRATALGLSAPIITGLLAACGSSDKATATKGAATGGGSTPTASGSTSGATASTGPGTTSPVAGTTPSTGSAAPTATTAANPNQQAGGGGLLRLLWWQAPTIMNPHLATGTKDFDASRVCYEPLADFDLEGNGIPMLAAEMPSLENGGVAQDGKSAGLMRESAAGR